MKRSGEERLAGLAGVLVNSKRCWNSALDEEMAADPNVFFMSNQVGEYQGDHKVGEYEGAYKVGEYEGAYKTIWDKGLEREQNVGVPIYGKRSDLLFSEVGNHVGAAGLRVAAAMLSAVKEASNMTTVS
nr:pyruvate dehydrogenase E1 component subunit beta, mitochondrial-like [Tanacetum cinerariifolium]